MSLLRTIAIIIALAFAAQGCGKKDASDIVGSWKSEDIGLDFPQWIVDTYSADGSVRTDFYARPPGKTVYHSEKVLHRKWRIRDEALEVGEVDDGNHFKRDGLVRLIKRDTDGKIVSIGGWKRVHPAMTQPATKKSN